MCLGAAASTAGVNANVARPQAEAPRALGPLGSGDAGDECVRHASQVAIGLLSSENCS